MTERSVSVKTEHRTICQTGGFGLKGSRRSTVHHNTEGTVKKETAKLAHVTSVKDEKRKKEWKREGR